MEVFDRWAALQFDNAVTMVGTAIENAAQEQMNHGSDKEPKWGAKYHMEDLLDDAYKLPRPLTKQEREAQAFESFKQMFSKG